MNGWLIAWLVILGLAVLVELSTVALVSIWFAIGAALAALFAWLQFPVWSQILVFVVVSGALFAIFFRKMQSRRLVKTNIDSLIGREAPVTEEIDNLHENGKVQLNGLSWSAKSEDGTIIPAGEVVVVRKIEGVHLIVAKKREGE